ncbi:MAG: T9SS type A sorting domain-containing protein, partial [Bacteroidia bacterium]
LAGLVGAPVPSKGLITVAISSDTGVPYEILNLHGQEVMSGTLMNGSNVLDIAALQQGCYHLRVQTNHGIVIKKIMKI